MRELHWLWLRWHGLLGLDPVDESYGGTRVVDLPSSCGSSQRLYRTLVVVCRPCVAAVGTTTPIVVHCDTAEGMFEARAKAYTVTSVDATTYMDTSSSFLFSRLASPDACRCAPPIVAGESGNSSVRYGGDQHPPSLCLGRALASVRLPPLRASPRMAPQGVVVADTPFPCPGMDACQCVPPTNASESENGSA